MSNIKDILSGAHNDEEQKKREGACNDHAKD